MMKSSSFRKQKSLELVVCHSKDPGMEAYGGALGLWGLLKILREYGAGRTQGGGSGLAPVPLTPGTPDAFCSSVWACC